MQFLKDYLNGLTKKQLAVVTESFMDEDYWATLEDAVIAAYECDICSTLEELEDLTGVEVIDPQTQAMAEKYGW